MDIQFIGKGLSFFQGYLGEQFPQCASVINHVGNSTASLVLVHTAIRNAPYVIFSNELHLRDISHAISSRISYCESILISAALLVYHLAIYTFAFVLVLLTFGLAEGINATFKEHSFHTAFSFFSLAISLSGLLFPSFGVYFTALLAKATWEQAVAGYQSDFKELNEDAVVAKIRNTWHDHQGEIRKTIQAFFINLKIARDNVRFDRQLSEIFRFSDEAVGKARTIHDLWNIFTKIFDGSYARPDVSES